MVGEGDWRDGETLGSLVPGEGSGHRCPIFGSTVEEAQHLNGGRSNSFLLLKRSLDP